MNSKTMHNMNYFIIYVLSFQVSKGISIKTLQKDKPPSPIWVALSTWVSPQVPPGPV